MKNKIFALICVFACFAFALSGCGLGGYVENGADKKPSVTPVNPDPVDPGNPDDPPPAELNYTVTVYYDGKPFDPGENRVTAVWRNDYGVKEAELGADGKASAGELDGDFAVYLDGLPSKYTYNPNGYTATADERNVYILLTDVTKPASGSGSGKWDCYSVKLDGAYRAEITKAGKYVYYEYLPKEAGMYVIESRVNAYTGDINPRVQTYATVLRNPDELIDDGGFSLDGSFTKNFRFEYRVAAQEQGNASAKIFAVTAESQSGEYPVYVDFEIKYLGEYAGSYEERTIRAKEAKYKAAEPKNGETFVFADMDTKVFDGKNFKYNEDTGFYHRYGAEFADDPYGFGVNFGPILCCALKKNLPSYTAYGASIYDFNAVGVGGGSNILRLYDVWFEDEGKYMIADYTDFIRIDYNKVCNSDGVCYLTPELKEFLQMFAERQSLYSDGVNASEGTPEYLGYSALNDGLWLFACGFYM